MKTLQNKAIEVFASVALTHRHHYNARPEHRARSDRWFSQRHTRRLAGGRGVFSAGDKMLASAEKILRREIDANTHEDFLGNLAAEL